MYLPSLNCKKLFILWALVAPLTAISATVEGGGSDGGGNWQEADFRKTAGDIAVTLLRDEDFSRKALGIEATDYRTLLDKVDVQCAFSPYLEKMRTLNKLAYFDSSSGSIYLDCENYKDLQDQAVPKNTLVFHEYMRKLVNEGSEYKVSSLLPGVLAALENGAQRRAQETGRCLTFVEGGSLLAPSALKNVLAAKGYILTDYSSEARLTISVKVETIDYRNSDPWEYLATLNVRDNVLNKSNELIGIDSMTMTKYYWGGISTDKAIERALAKLTDCRK